MTPTPLVDLCTAVRAFVETEVPPHEAELYRTARLPEPLRARMAELGLFGIDLPAAWGGLGLNMMDTCTLVEELSRGPQALVRWSGVSTTWFDEQSDPDTIAVFRPFLDRLLSGHDRFAFALTEPDAGTDAGAIRTRAERQGDVYVVNGRKHLITFGSVATAYLTMVKTDPDAGPYGITALLIDADTPGCDDSRLQPAMGLHGVPVSEIVFEDCAVPVSRRVGEEGQGFLIAMQGLDGVRLKLIAAVAVGAAQAVLEYCTAYVRDGRAEAAGTDVPWAKTALADMAADIGAARGLVRTAAEQFDAGARGTTGAAMCKFSCAEMNDRVADLGVQIVGRDALDPAHPINRFYRDARLGRIWDGTSEIQRFIVARALLSA